MTDESSVPMRRKHMSLAITTLQQRSIPGLSQPGSIEPLSVTGTGGDEAPEQQQPEVAIEAASKLLPPAAPSLNLLSLETKSRFSLTGARTVLNVLLCILVHREPGALPSMESKLPIVVPSKGKSKGKDKQKPQGTWYFTLYGIFQTTLSIVPSTSEPDTEPPLALAHPRHNATCTDAAQEVLQSVPKGRYQC